MLRRVLATLSLFALLVAPPLAAAQDDGPPAGNQKFGILQGLGGGLGGLGGPAADDNVKLRGSFTVQEGGRRGVLSLEATIARGWHVYSISQKPGGPGASKD